MKTMMNLFKSKKKRQLDDLKESFLLGKLSTKDYKEKVYMVDPEEWERIATPEDKELLQLNESYNHNLISTEEYKSRLKFLDIDRWITLLDDKEKYKYNLETKLSSGKIRKEEYDKEILTLEGKPYIGITNIEFDPENGIGMEFDWNDYFIEELKENGFTGNTDQDLINDWYNSFCAMVASQSDKVILTDPEDIRKVTKKKNKTEHF